MKLSKKFYICQVILLAMLFTTTVKAAFKPVIASGTIHFVDGTSIDFYGIYSWPGVYPVNKNVLKFHVMIDKKKREDVPVRNVSEVKIIGGVVEEGNPGFYFFNKVTVLLTTVEGKTLVTSNNQYMGKGPLGALYVYLNKNDFLTKKENTYEMFKGRKQWVERVVFHNK